jgi:two-component system chemotaxis response regulator CheB
MPKIRVLVVDDSVVIRKLLTEHLGNDPEIEVIGTASDGKIGLARIPELNPDIVILDIEMPVMDGLQTLPVLRKAYPALPVIMFSTLTERGASATLDALTLGANDYATKNIDKTNAQQHISTHLAPKIKALCQRRTSTTILPASGTKATPITPFIAKTRAPQQIDVVTIGVSTGGPNALATVVAGLPKDFPVPIVIVQHMPQMFTRLLAERLSNLCPLQVQEGSHGQNIEPGQIWIAPGGYHMEVERTRNNVSLRIHEGPFENSCRPAVDVLFRSVAEVYGGNVLAVILTGMGQDGLRGCEVIREKGGRILIQDEATSVVWGMPGAVCRAGIADKMVPLSQISTEINTSVKGISARAFASRNEFRPATSSLTPAL